MARYIVLDNGWNDVEQSYLLEMKRIGLRSLLITKVNNFNTARQ